MYWWLLTYLLVGFPAWASAPSPSYFTDLYGEVSTLEREGGYASSLVARGKLPLGAFRAYLGAHWEAYVPDAGGIRRVSPLLGLERSLGPVRLFAEYRYVFESPRTSYSRHDPRFGATGGYWWQGEESRWGYWISDSYGELISLPRIQALPALTLFSKWGWRKPLASRLYLDPYVEAFVQESPDPAMGRDAREGRGGIRLAWGVGEGLVSLAAFRRLFSLVDAPAPRVRFLLSAGGTF